jgi:hypothetical protein
MTSQVKILLFVLAVLSPITIFSQTGPGGVGNATGTNGQPANALWLDAASLTGLSSGGKVSQWTDRSGNSRPASQATTANQPTYVTNVLNGQPVIRFDRGTSPQFLQITAAGTGNLVSGSRSVFLVAKANAGANASNRQGLFIAPLPNSGISFENSTNTRIVYEQFGAGGAYLQQKNNISGNTLGWYLINQMAFTSPTYTSIWNNLNGFANAGVGAAEPMRTYPDLVYLGRADFDWYLQGDMAEVIAYGTNVSNTQRIIVENYLSAKYGIAVASDFYTAHEASYIRDVQGIGTVDGTDKHSLASAGQGLVLGELNSSLNAANEFVFAGHNAAANGLTNSDSPQYYNRWQRSWYVQKTGAVDARLSFDFVQAGLTVPSNLGGNLASYRLFYRSAATGAFGIVTGVTPTLQGSGGIGFDLTNAQLASGYYTLGLVATPTFTWSPSAVTTDWNTAANWTEGIVPTSSGDVIVNACTICPVLNANTTINSVTLNTGANLTVGSYNLVTTGQTQLSYANLTSTGGQLTANSISATQATFAGNMTLQAASNTVSNFQGVTTFTGTVVINLSGNLNINAPAGQKCLFQENAVINLLAGPEAYEAGNIYVGGAYFKKDLTVNATCELANYQAFKVVCDGRFQVNASGNQNQSIGVYGRSAFKGVVAIDIAGTTTPDISFSYDATYPDSLVVFKDSIIVNKPAGSNSGIYFTGCRMDSTALVKVNSFYFGNMGFNKCVFARRSTPLTLSMPSDCGGLSLVSSVFEGETLVSSPSLLWVTNRFDSNTQITLLPLAPAATWSGTLYTGGNLYRKKITILNQTADKTIAMGQFLKDTITE